MADPYSDKTRNMMKVLIDVEQIWRETVPPGHELSAEQRKKLIDLLRKAQKNLEQLIEFVEGRRR